LHVVAARLRASALRLLAWVAAVVALYALLGFIALPMLLRPFLERELSDATGRAVTVGKLETNPFKLSATVEQVSMAERESAAPALTLERLYARVSVKSLLRWAPVVDRMTLTHPTINVVRNQDNSYNFSDLIAHMLEGPAGPTPRFAVSNIEVADGTVTFDDRPAGRRHEVTGIAIGIPFISSLPSQTDIEVEPSFSALVNGRPVSLRGETKPFKDTRETTVHLDLKDVALATYAAYLPASVPVVLRNGILGCAIDLRFVAHAGANPELSASGTVDLRDLDIVQRDGGKLLRVPSLAVAVDRFDPIGRSVQVRSVAIDSAELEVHRAASGEVNLVALAGPAPASSSRPSSSRSSSSQARSSQPSSRAPSPQPSPPQPSTDAVGFAYAIGDLAIRHAVVHADDRSVAPAFAVTLSDVDVHVTNLSSAPGRNASVEFSFATDSGAHFSHRGILGIATPHASGHLEATNVRLNSLLPYYASAVNLVVDDGRLDAALDFSVAKQNDALDFALKGIEARASDLKLRLPDEKEFLWRVPVTVVRGGSVDAKRHAVHFDRIESRGAVGNIRRNADGTFRLSRVLRVTAHASQLAPDKAAASAPWRVTADALSLDDYDVNFEDRTVEPAGRMALRRVSLRLDGVSNATNHKSRATFRARLGKSGTMDLSGSVSVSPFSANVKARVKDIALAPLQPYLAREVDLRLTDGRLSARGDVAIATTPETRASFKGELDVNDFAVVDDTHTDLLSFTTLALTGIDAQSEPLALAIGDITLDRAHARMVLSESGELNLAQVRSDDHAVGTPASKAPAPQPGPTTAQADTGTTWLKLGKATITNSSLDFTDHFVRPNYSASLAGLSGTISSLTFDHPAEIELRGTVQGTSPVQISGRINPLARDLFLDIKARATDIEMPQLSPYSAKYVGYGIEKGKLSMDVAYRVEGRKLEAKNQITLDQLTFGSKVDSPDAIKAPVLLAVSLLKDRNGVIEFDLPIAGSIDDPQFSVGGLVMRALGNLIVKIATAPFALLGSIGGNSQDLSYVEFAPGSVALSQAADGKINALAKALKDRPGVKVDMTGYVDREEDTAALKHEWLLRQVRSQKFEELVKRGQAPRDVNAVEVPPAEYETLLRRAYKAAKFRKPSNALGFEKDVPRQEMETLMLANASVTDDDLRSLAQRRAESVRSALVDRAGVPADRVFVRAPQLEPTAKKEAGKPTRVDFALH
jgi:flagellar motor protein MotB